MDLGRAVDRDRDRVDSRFDELPRMALQASSVGDDRACQTPLLDLAHEREDVGIEEGLPSEEAHDRRKRSDLV